jgi:hypothetical protein
MADLSHLGGLNPVEQLDLGNYADNKESTFRLPAKGVYTLQAPDTFPAAAFTRTKAGALSIQIDPTIVGPTHEGLTVRFVKVSAKPFQRDGKTVSQVGDYLRACGFKGVLTDEQAIADAVESTASAIYQAKLDWRAYNSKTGFSLQGMERFPKLADGTYQSWVEDPTAKDENGNPVKVRANLIIDRFVPASE